MTEPTAPIRKSSLPCIPPPEWEFHTWFPHPDGGGDMVPGERQRGVLVRRRVSYGDWEPVRPDRWADEPPTDASSAGVVQMPPTNQAAWVDGDPLMEAIAAAVWEQCSTEGTSLVVDDPRNIAVAAASALPAPVDRAAVYRALADQQTQLAVADDLARRRDMAAARRQLVRELRRLAAEAPAIEEQSRG